MITLYSNSDLQEILDIHSKFYDGEFPIEDFQDIHDLGKFVIRDDEDGSIIVAANVRAIAEIVAITNKDSDVHKRRAALYQLLDASMFSIGSNGFTQLHVFVQDPKWEKHLIRAKFRETKGKMLVYG